MQVPYKDFNALSVPLQSSNLIEASAGTGKTYSVAILVLRLIVENAVPVKEILMVTFTKAAVAELEERIRLFIRMANQAAEGQAIDDRNIQSIVEKASEQAGKERVLELLRNAVLFLDETSVLTIHSFCQQTLNEFAFETRQLFGAEMLPDINTILTGEVNLFWRRNITSLPTPLLAGLQPLLSRKGLKTIVTDHLSGKRYLEYQPGEDYNFCDEDSTALLAVLENLAIEESELQQCLLKYVTDNAKKLDAISATNSYTRKMGLDFGENPKESISLIAAKASLSNVQKVFPDILERLEQCGLVAERRAQTLQQALGRLSCMAINAVEKGVTDFKLRNNQMSFDDLIVKLHDALVKQNNQVLVEALRRKYKAVFIDEFQDTDRLQYEIFNRAFAEETVLFYIGDPKQSIYAWRKADIFTYFKARESVNQLYSMNQNFRSSGGLITAMNAFFKPTPDFDTFYFQYAADSINYIPVESPDISQKYIFRKGEIETPISITELPNINAIVNELGAQIALLLNPLEFEIESGDIRQWIKPSDIGVLVKTKKQGQQIKARLARLRIPAVSIDDSKVLQSDEALLLLYVLISMLDISRSTINRALFSALTNFGLADLEKLEVEEVIALFRNYKLIWDENGIYSALKSFMADFNVEEILTGAQAENGERVITNLYQLMELLHKTQTQKKLSPPELISWLKRGIETTDTEGDEFQQRIESDEEAVKIVTIHSSKGLEYPIVFAPFLDLKTDSKFPQASFREEESGEYVSAPKTSLSDVQTVAHREQVEQENRRLIYVAVTRAVYKCFIYRNTHSKESSLSVFVDAQKIKPSNLIAFTEAQILSPDFYYEGTNSAKKPKRERPKVRFSLAHQNWKKLSYSSLKPIEQPGLKSRAGKHDDSYEHFIFAQLIRGAKTGNMLHFIFENIQFSNHNGWEKVLKSAVKRLAPSQRELYLPMLRIFIRHILNTIIHTNDVEFTVASITTGSFIPEFEFDFPVSPFQVGALRELSDAHAEVRVRDLAELEGVMNGKIDLFFEVQGKYFVLDWKSNYLGDGLEHFQESFLLAAMNENNYHLQYLIYSLAAKKYLESRVPGFSYADDFGGVIYLFLRGIREGATTGIFTLKPSVEKIERLNEILTAPPIAV